MPPTRYRVSPFVQVSWVDGEMVIFCPTSRDELRTADAGAVAVLHAFATPATTDEVAERLADEIEAGDLRAAVAALAEIGALIDADGPGAVLSGWEPHDLAFHRISRAGAGATFPGRGTDPPPPVKLPMSDDVRALPEPVALPALPLADALALRCTRKHYAVDEPLELDSLSSLLHMSCRNIDPPPERSIGRWHRPYPSGGGCYSLEVYLLLADRAVRDLPRGLYHYCPQRHALETLAVDVTALESFPLAARGAARIEQSPPVLLLITSRIGRVSYKYEGLGYSLVLKEVGCLFSVLYLAAIALGLAPCALGRGLGVGDDRLAAQCGFAPLEEVLVGEFMLGAPLPGPYGD